MLLVSIQIGTPRTVGTPDASDPASREFTSAIWKEPVPGPIRVGALGLAGDAVANRRVHGGPDQALLAYTAAHYGAWRREWDDPTLGPGDFGENLTVDGPDEEGVCIGDRWAIGSVLLEVTAPREPCATLSRRHGRPDLVKVVHGNGRGGWYLRVLHGGELAPGLPIALLDRPHPDWTIRRAAAVLRSRAGRPDEAAALALVPPLAVRARQRLVRASGSGASD